ncbi:uncharacterized protein METZ01_LOCUS267042, partial [marine metagenome]
RWKEFPHDDYVKIEPVQLYRFYQKRK